MVPVETPKVVPFEDRIDPSLPPQLNGVLLTFEDVFPEGLPKGLPSHRDIDHCIELVKEAPTPKHRVYRMAYSEKAELKKQLDAYLAQGQIIHARTAFGAGVLFAAENGGDERLSVDYRQLNKITIKDAYPIPRIDATLDRLVDAKQN